MAWEPSWGAIDGLTFEVKRSRHLTGDLSQTITFEEIFADTPVFLADVQGHTASHALGVRWNQKSLAGATVTVDLDHVARIATTLKAPVIGYIAIRETVVD